MADKRINAMRRRLQWLFALSLGAALAFAVIFAVGAFITREGPLAIWGGVLGFLVVVMLVFVAMSARLRKVERQILESSDKVKNTGTLLAEQVAARELAEANLREEAMFPQLNPGPTLRFDIHGTVTRFNDSAHSLIGLENLAESKLQDLIDGLEDEDIERCIQRGIIEPHEVEWNGRWYICHLRGVPELATGLLYASDITAMKEKEQELEHLEGRTRAILDGAADAIMIVATGGIVQAVNPATEKLFGWKHDEIVGQNVDVLMPELFEHRGGDKLWILAEWSRRKSTGRIEKVIHGVRKNGNTFPLSLAVAVYEFEGQMRVSCIVRDITERIMADELQQAQAEKLREQYTEMKQLVAELNEFNYVASHDLQEPLRTMSTYCGLLKADLGDNLPERAEEDVSAILDASLRMQRLITDLLEYSRSGHTELKMIEVDLNEVLDRVRSDLKARMSDTDGSVEVGELPVVYGDSMQLGRVFQNLVSNGLKFRRPHVPPKVEVSSTQEGDYVVLKVKDNGIGIPEDYAGKIFQPFKRLHGVGKYEGSGIGLSICRKIVGRHGGTIEAIPAADGGSCFVVKLPATKTVAQAAAEANEG